MIFFFVEQKTEFWLLFFANMKLHTQPAMLARQGHCFSWKCPPITMHGNFHCVKFHDFTLYSDGLVFTFALTCYQKAYFFIPGGHFNWKKNNNFWVIGNYSNVVCKVLCGQKKITIRVLATSAWIANKICPKFWHANFFPYGEPWQNFWNGFWLLYLNISTVSIKKS